ncbi:MAG: nucleotide sugar dehydrogenase [Selenomonadaceae bacterium]|nr:nucleotide sugar dehydrogenase [Selenomonadaceae bacterium]
MNIKDELLAKIAERSLVAGVVGLGYVGLPLAVDKALAGFRTIGFDVQQVKVDRVNAGENYIGDVVAGDLQKLVAEGRLQATTDYSRIREVDFVAICVPTPLDAHQEPDITYVRESAQSVAKYLTPGTMVVLESTTYPGTTEELLRPILEDGSGLKCGQDFFLGFSPERVDPGNLVYKTKNTPKVVGAIGEDAQECIAAMYRAVLDGEVYTVSSPAVAEMEKILENTYRNINIGLINEIGRLCHKMGISVWEVIEAAKTKPYGFQAFYPGPGLGGHCIPLDPYYLTWKAREYGFHTTLIENSMVINDGQPRYCVQRAMHILNQAKKAINGAKVLVLGVAYKGNIDDYRESPAIDVIGELQKVGADVTYYDPWVPAFRHGGLQMTGLKELTPETVEQADLVMITTAHKNVDYEMVQQHAKAIFDTKNIMGQYGSFENVEVL